VIAIMSLDFRMKSSQKRLVLRDKVYNTRNNNGFWDLDIKNIKNTIVKDV